MVAGTTNEKVRKAWLEKTLLSLSSGSTILDAGAGELANKRFCEHLKYTSQDFCQYDGSGNKHALQMDAWDTTKIDIVSDIENIPVSSSSFDSILCSEVLEHLSTPEKAIAEFSRILKPDGVLILTAPFCSLTHFAPYHFSSGFNRYFYEYHLKDKNFEILEISGNGNFFEFMAQELMRLPTVANKYSSLKLNRIENVCIRIILKLLNKLSNKDQGSQELLCFGYMIKARKLK